VTKQAIFAFYTIVIYALTKIILTYPGERNGLISSTISNRVRRDMKEYPFVEIIVFPYNEYIGVQFRASYIAEYMVKIANGIFLPEMAEDEA